MTGSTTKLTAPAGNMEKLKLAISSGADRILLGGKILNMKAGTENFNDEELKEAVQFVHDAGKEIYVTLNAVPHNKDIEELPEYVQFLKDISVDGVMVSDFGVFQCVRELADLPIIVNTHSSNTNWRSVKMWKDLGAGAVVLDRDITISNIMEIRAKVPDIKLEVSVHGPINLAISGRTLISNFLTGKGTSKEEMPNALIVEEATRPGENMPVYEDTYGTYIYSARDLCALELIEHLLLLGVDSIKIEGGMKDNHYISTVVGVYREVLDSYAQGNHTYSEEWMERLKSTTDKPFITWFSN